ncbi:MAG: hypothetical protein RLY21_1327 [Planctomycetota bacterium]
MIDRIAYSPYGEATRTLRSDVNGDGFVNQSDYAGEIKPRIGAAIGTAAYVVESVDAKNAAKPLSTHRFNGRGAIRRRSSAKNRTGRPRAFRFFLEAGEGDRTLDIYLGKVTLYR